MPLVHEWLSTDAYWALGRSAETLARAIAGSLCFGVYDAGPAPRSGSPGWSPTTPRSPGLRRLRGAARSGARAWAPGWSRVIRDHLIARAAYPRLLLATQDAHEVYARAGFAPLARPAAVDGDRPPPVARPA